MAGEVEAEVVGGAGQAPTDEVQGQVAEQPAVEQTPAGEASSDEQAFLAGFNGDESSEPTKAKPSETVAQAADSVDGAGGEPVAAQAAEPTNPEAATDPASYTPEQVRELIDTVRGMQQRESKVFGTLGAIKQQIDAMKAQPSVAPAAIAVTADKLKRLSKEFPEMAAMLAEDLSEVMVGNSQAPSLDKINEIVTHRVNEGLTETTQKLEVKLLTILHPDWRTVAATPEFDAWKRAQPADVQQQLDDGWDSEYLGKKLTEFKASKARAEQARQTSRQRLQAATVPSGNQHVRRAPTDEEAFLEGWNSGG